MESNFNKNKLKNIASINFKLMHKIFSYNLDSSDEIQAGD